MLYQAADVKPANMDDLEEGEDEELMRGGEHKFEEENDENGMVSEDDEGVLAKQLYSYVLCYADRC